MGRFEQLIKAGKPPIMGVDIGSTRIRLLELDTRAGPGRHRILSYASEALSADAIADDQVADPQALADAVTRALKRSGSRTRAAAIAVSGSAVISKVIEMPAGLTETELEQQLAFDAEQYIPHPIEEVNLDFQVLEADADNQDVDRVLLVACRRENIEGRVGALGMAGLKVRVVDVEQYALQNACSLLMEQTPALTGEASVAVFDVGAFQTRLSVQRNGRSAYSRDLSFGAQTLADQLIEGHDLKDMDQLRGRLRTRELDHDAVAKEVDGFADRLTGQIDRALQFYIATASSDEAIDRILLVGDGTLYPGLAEALSSRLERPVSAANPLAGMLASGAARRNHVDHEAPALMVAAGLALRSPA